MLNETELQEIEKRCEGMNPGTWAVGAYLRQAYETDIPALLSTVRELQRQNVELRSELDGDDLPLRDKLEMAENLVEELQRQVQERETEIYRLCDELKTGEQTYG